MNLDYSNKIERKLNSISNLSVEVGILNKELKDVKLCLNKAVAHYRIKKNSLESEPQSNNHDKSIPLILRKNSYLAEANRELADDINKVTKFWKKLMIDNTEYGRDLKQVVIENESLRNLVTLSGANIISKKEEIKTITPSRNSAKSHKPMHIKAQSLNENPWNDSCEENPYSDTNDNIMTKKLMKNRQSLALRLGPKGKDKSNTNMQFKCPFELTE